jgi:hypothetical protein
MLRLSVGIFALVLAMTATAESRCDCAHIVGQCKATVTELKTQSVGSKFHIQANTSQCAIVEWSVDGQRGETTIWDDGEDVSRVSPRKPGGEVEVGSCRVCRDQEFSKTSPQESLSDKLSKMGCEKVTDDGASLVCAKGPDLTVYCKSDGSAHRALRLPDSVPAPPKPEQGMTREQYETVNRAAIDRYKAYLSQSKAHSASVMSALDSCH